MVKKPELKKPEERKRILDEYLKKQTKEKRDRSIKQLSEEIEKSEKETRQKKEREERENSEKKKAEQELEADELVLEIKSKSIAVPEAEEKTEERKYVPKRQATDEPESGLERELVSDKAPVPDKFTHAVEVKEQFRRDISYRHDISGQRIFDTLVHYVREEGFDINSINSATAQQAITGRVMAYFGNSVSPEQVAGYISSLRQTGGWLSKDNLKSLYKVK